SFQQNTGSFQETVREDSPIEVATLLPKTKKSTRNRQKRTFQSDDAPRQATWTNEEEIALFKTWVHVSDNNTIVPKFTTKSGGGSKRNKSSRSSSFNTESEKASINLNANVGDDEEDEEWEIRRPIGRDKAKDTAKKKGSRVSGSSSMNDEALARLMVTNMANQEKEERLASLEIKMGDVECREREIRNQEYKQRQKDLRFYLQPYDHLSGIRGWQWKN
nr:hypothetical protein [Tanacetum cinerariifolium]